MMGIYAIRRLADGACYVGSSKEIRLRWRGHRMMLKSGTHHAPYLQHSWNSYGAQAHEFVVLETCALDRSTLVAREQFYIDTLPSVFNASRVAGSRLGVPQPRAAVDLVASLNRGMKRSDETRARMSAWQKGQPKPSSRRRKSVETRRRMSAAQLGRPKSSPLYGKHWIGRTHSDEARAKMSLARKGRHCSAETRIKIGAAHAGNSWGLGYKKTAEQIEKTASFHRGRKRSEEARVNMRAGIAAAKANRSLASARL